MRRRIGASCRPGYANDSRSSVFSLAHHRPGFAEWRAVAAYRGAHVSSYELPAVPMRNFMALRACLLLIANRRRRDSGLRHFAGAIEQAKI